jgi:hypothetical protein
MQRYIKLAMEARKYDWTEWYYECERCWNNEWVDYHHILWRGPNLNNIFTIILLCRQCHQWVHSNNRKEVKENLLKKIEHLL